MPLDMDFKSKGDDDGEDFGSVVPGQDDVSKKSKRPALLTAMCVSKCRFGVF